MSGQEGSFAVIDARSHRLPRVCRSTYAAELLGVEESVDVGQMVRGFWGAICGLPVLVKRSSVEAIALTCVTDAKDVYDRNTSDTASYGSQKSLCFTIAWPRAQLRRPRTDIKWTSTDNMFVDGGTKENFDLTHMQKILQSCRWNVCYEPKFVKQGAKRAKGSNLSDGAVITGEPLDPSSPILGYLMKLGETSGWHFKDGIPVQVARNARSFRLPNPRFDALQYPKRSSYGRFDFNDGRCEWRKLEDHVQYDLLQVKQGLIGDEASVLVTFFHGASVNKRNVSTVKTCV